MAQKFLTGINIVGDSLSISGVSVISSARHAAFVNLTTTGDTTLGNAVSDGMTINGNTTINTTGVTNNVLLTSADTSASSAPDLVLRRTAAVADEDTLGVLEFQGMNGMVPSSTVPLTYGAIYSRMIDKDNNQTSLSFSAHKGNGSGAYIHSFTAGAIGTNNSATGSIIINPADVMDVSSYNLEVRGTSHITGAATFAGAVTITGSLTAAGINPTSLTTPLIQLQGDLDILNKAQTSYLDLAARDTSGGEVVYNLSNLGTGGFAGAVTWSGGGSANANTAYTYSQVGHLPLAGGTMTGNITFNNSVRSIIWPHTSGQSTSRAYAWVGEQGAYGRFALRSSNAADDTIDTNVLYFDNDLSATFAGSKNLYASFFRYGWNTSNRTWCW